jgi:hypothetical protein
VRRFSFRSLGAVLAAAVCVSGARAVGPQDSLAFLRKYVRAGDSDWRRLERGGVFTKTLDAPDGKEVTSFGVIRVSCAADTFAARVRDIERFKASEYVLQIGRFQPSPSLQDVAPLTLDPGDREAMRECKPGSCALRLPAAAIDRFRTTIQWGTPAEDDAAAAAMRQFLVDEARAYMAGGSASLADYADRTGTVPRGAAFRLLLRPSAFEAEYQPDLFRYLAEFPRSKVEGWDSFLYWSREKFGLKPVISISHSVLQRRDGVVVFGSKQVFASHYFESSLGMALFVPVPGTSYGYVTYLNRSRVDTLRGLLAPLARVVAARRARDGLERMLIDVKRKLEKSAEADRPQVVERKLK